MTAITRLELTAVPGLPIIEPGDDLAGVIADCLEAGALVPREGDAIVVAQKIVSKAENRFVALTSVTPSPRAVALAAEVGKDPRVVEIVLSESRDIVRRRPGLIIAEHLLGFIMANAGVDQSNVGPEGEERLLLLPRDPDASAARLRAGLKARFGVDVGVVINDSFGRAWRVGTCGVAIGVAGLPAVFDRRGQPDLFGRALKVTVVGFADELAAAASLVMGQADENQPVVLARGLRWSGPVSPAAALVRAAADDLFR